MELQLASVFKLDPLHLWAAVILNFKSVHRTIQCIFSRIITCFLPLLAQNYTGTTAEDVDQGGVSLSEIGYKG